MNGGKMAFPFPNHIKIALETADFSEDMYALENEQGSKIYAYDAFFIRLLSEVLHFSFSILPVMDGVGKRGMDGNWSGLFGLLQREEADLIVDSISITEERTKVVDFSPPYYVSDITFLTHNPESLRKNLAILYPFNRNVWIIATASIFILSGLFYGMKRRTRSYPYVLLRVFGSVLEQDLHLKFRSWHKRLVIFIWITSVMFLSYSYKGLLLSYLSFPPMKDVHNVAELSKAVADGSHACFTFKGSYFITQLMESD